MRLTVVVIMILFGSVSLFCQSQLGIAAGATLYNDDQFLDTSLGIIELRYKIDLSTKTDIIIGVNTYVGDESIILGTKAAMTYDIFSITEAIPVYGLVGLNYTIAAVAGGGNSSLGYNFGL